MSQKTMLKTSNTKVEVAQPEVVKSLPDKIAEWTSIVGERGIAVKHDFVATFEELKRKDLILYRVEEITYEEDSPQLEALENALRENSVRLRTDIRGEGAFALSFSGISEEKIDDGIRIISETIKEII